MTSGFVLYARFCIWCFLFLIDWQLTFNFLGAWKARFLLFFSPFALVLTSGQGLACVVHHLYLLVHPVGWSCYLSEWLLIHSIMSDSLDCHISCSPIWWLNIYLIQGNCMFCCVRLDSLCGTTDHKYHILLLYYPMLQADHKFHMYIWCCRCELVLGWGCYIYFVKLFICLFQTLGNCDVGYVRIILVFCSNEW